MIRRPGRCAICGAETDNTNGEFCVICDDLKDVCWRCMGQHLTGSHTQAEYLKVQAECLGTELGI